MITYGTGDLLLADVDALVNAVNTVGVMGKGIALRFKQAYPENFQGYKASCARGDVIVGRMHVHEIEEPRPEGPGSSSTSRPSATGVRRRGQRTLPRGWSPCVTMRTSPTPDR